MPPLVQRFWRSLEELEDPDAAQGPARDEFPEGAAADAAGMSRRVFVQLLGAGAAGAGCATRSSPSKIVPYAARPPDLVPGVPNHYATGHVQDGFATGLIVSCEAGRPLKVEGHPAHPASLGATSAIAQSLVFGLYDPDRARGVTQRGRPRRWDDFAADLRRELEVLRQRDGGAGLRLLVEPTASGLLQSLRARVRARFPQARVVAWTPLGRENVYEGARLALGQPVETLYDLSQAEVVLALDADLFGTMPGALRHARQFMDQRRVRSPGDAMNRLYVVEAAWTPGGTVADHRFPARPSAVGTLLRALLAAVMRRGREPAPLPAALRARLLAAPAPGGEARWIEAVAADLVAHAGRCVVAVGPRQPAWVHALAHLLHAALGVVGRTVRHVAPALDAPGSTGDLAALVDDVRAGRVEHLAILGGNPAYSGPAGLDLAAVLGSVPASVVLSPHRDETVEQCTAHVAQAHDLEVWGDGRAPDGTVSFQQPLVQGLFDARSEVELTALYAGAATGDPRELLQAAWRERRGGADFEAWWERALQDGVVPDSAAPALATALRAEGLEPLLAGAPGGADGLELDLVPSAKLLDGRHANNPWLMELPDTVTKLTWGNAAMLGVATARRLGISTGEMVELQAQGRTLEAPALVVPGQAEGVVTLELGWGRRAGGTTARGVGVNGYLLRGRDTPWGGPGLALRRTGGTTRLATTQQHWSTEGRSVAREVTLADFARDPDRAGGRRHRALTLYQPRYTGEQWGMAIDLNACTGCNACVVACQAENNVPIVGKDGVLRSREMHWLRIDTYFDGPAGAPRVLQQPMACQHCEKAPCEYVCPVNATVHSHDGLNEMVYNRCVGTRYCSNNCPYKVRRFNFYEYQSYHQAPTVRDLALNPDVTVRSRGVMEKCTYCVQRIRRTGIDARVQGRAPADGDVVTACQQACPTQAITFGNVGDPRSAVSRQHASRRAFGALEELGTEPRTKYLARVRNPNPELE